MTKSIVHEYPVVVLTGFSVLMLFVYFTIMMLGVIA